MKKLIIIMLLLMPFMAFATQSDGKPEILKVIDKTFILDTIGGTANDGDTVFYTSDIFSVDCDTLFFIAEWTGGLYVSTATNLFTAFAAATYDSLEFYCKLQATSPEGKTNPLITFTALNNSTYDWDTTLIKLITTPAKTMMIGNPIIKNTHYMTAKAHVRIVNKHPARRLKYNFKLYAVRKWM